MRSEQRRDILVAVGTCTQRTGAPLRISPQGQGATSGGGCGSWLGISCEVGTGGGVAAEGVLPAVEGSPQAHPLH